MSKTVDLGRKPRYPITIVKLLRSPGDTIEKQEVLLQYSYKWKRTVGDHVRGETREEEVTSIVDWDSPVEGELQKWHVKEGDIITRDQTCLEVKEPCSHEIQFQGLCAICGKDMTEVNWAAETRDTARAPINMTHDNTNLKVSQSRAIHAENELQRRLISQRKLTLVVDLDQTIIHACIEPTIGEWQRDPTNPNHEAVKDVRSFQLNDDAPRGLASGCWYYIKLRPGLEEFLQRIKDKFELHVYTMGTRQYAENIAKLVDPEQKLFGSRVISRDENGSMTAKSLQRLFPTSTNMVVIIDDRADVWPRNRRNLIKVTPYDFFKGIGDINSSFLPKREDDLRKHAADESSDALKKEAEIPNGKAPETPKETKEGEKASALDDFVKMSGGTDEATTKRQIEEQEKTLEQQIKDRPLLHLQEQLDKEDEEAEKSETNGGDQPAPEVHQRHRVLFDDDHELNYLEQHLTRLHEAYFEEYDAVAPESAKPVQKVDKADDKSSPNIDLSKVPDVGDVLESLKSQALSGTRIVLSGLVPLGVDVRVAEIGLQLVSFGADLRTNVTKDITHLVVSSSRPRTRKVQQAAKYPHIKIVNQDWLAECLTQWSVVDETPYLIDIDPYDRPGANGVTPAAETTEDEMLDDGDEVEDAIDGSKPRGKIVRLDALKVKIVNEDQEAEPGEDDEVQKSPLRDIGANEWEEIDAELAEFLSGEDVDEDEDEDDDDEDYPIDDEEIDPDGAEDESMVDGLSQELPERPTPSRKRKHDDDDTVDGSESEAGQGDTNTAKKKRLWRSKGFSSLRAEFNSAEVDSSLPTPQITDAADDGDDEQDGGNDDADDDFDLDAELEAELEAELDAANGDGESVPAASQEQQEQG